jgi:hypothetical protein
MDIQLGGDLPVDAGEESFELTGAMPAVDLPDHLAGGDVRRGEQRGDPTADAVVAAAFSMNDPVPVAVRPAATGTGLRTGARFGLRHRCR